MSIFHGKIKNHKDNYSNSMNKSELKLYEKLLLEINNKSFEYFGEYKIAEYSTKLINRAKSGESLDNILVEAYALAREAAFRTLGMRPFDVQVMAAIAMHYGKLVEMQTGEGKTLAAVLPAYLNALSGKGVHILTFNDYLANRDAEWMGPIYRLLGLTVGSVREGMSKDDRIRAYNSDVTYVTAKEAGFDYLRDSISYEKYEKVHRQYHFAIIDEADSILIDEARVPLVIAGEFPNSGVNAARMAELVCGFQQGMEYELDDYGRNVHLTDTGVQKVEKILGCGNLYASQNIELLTGINSALHAKVLLKRDVDYIVRNGKIELVDEFTGRIADKRHWPDGLQEAVEAKEGIILKSKGRIIGSITLQNYIKCYPKLCGMTATAMSSADEFYEFYDMEVAVIPTNRPCIRMDYPDLVFTHKEAKYKSVIEEISKLHKAGRPVLIGTTSIEESDLLASMLLKAGVACEILNAKNDEMEAKIIAQAGQLGAVTVSTNMAGRGTDIRLGGEDEHNKEKVKALGGLYVIGLNRHESVRVDNQLRGRAGRQGDPGSSRFFISLEDNLVRQYGIERVVPLKYLGLKSDSVIEDKYVNDSIAHVQRVVQGQNFDIRRTLQKYWFILEQQRRIIQARRENILLEEDFVQTLPDKEPERYEMAKQLLGNDRLKAIEKRISLYCVDQCWSDHLDYVEYIREGIHLVSISGHNPLDEFHKLAIEAFDKLMPRIDAEIARIFNAVEITGDGVDFDKEGIKGPSSTWTYIVCDNYFLNNLGMYLLRNGNASFAAAAVGSFVTMPLVLWSLIYQRFIKKSKPAK